MSEKLGIVGQSYENRKSKKTGVLMRADSEKRVLEMLNTESGEPFTVSESTFKRIWRKVRSESVDSAVESVEEVTRSNDDFVLPGGSLDEFNRIVSQEHAVRFTANPEDSDAVTLLLDEISAVFMEKSNDGIYVTMLPDLYTYSSIRQHIVFGTLKFDVSNDMSVKFVCNLPSFISVLCVIQEAAHDINLYGYLVPNEEEGEDE